MSRQLVCTSCWNQAPSAGRRMRALDATVPRDTATHNNLACGAEDDGDSQLKIPQSWIAAWKEMVRVMSLAAAHDTDVLRCQHCGTLFRRLFFFSLNRPPAGECRERNSGATYRKKRSGSVLLFVCSPSNLSPAFIAQPSTAHSHPFFFLCSARKQAPL